MANTYTLIASNTLSSSAASVTFSSIPNTYTDLVIRTSTRSDKSATNENINVFINTPATDHSWTRIFGNGSAASSNRGTSQNQFTMAAANDAATATANTFASIELYIPSYTASQYKPFSTFGAQENNNATAFIYAHAGLYSNNSAITSIKIEVDNPSLYNFVSGSSFFLYGIKNS